MNRLEHTVTLPLRDYEHLIKQETDFTKLKKAIVDTFDKRLYDGNNNLPLQVSSVKLVDIAKEYLPVKYKDIRVEIIL